MLALPQVQRWLPRDPPHQTGPPLDDAAARVPEHAGEAVSTAKTACFRAISGHYLEGSSLSFWHYHGLAVLRSLIDLE